MPAWARRLGGFGASRRGFLQRTASALLLCALFGLLLIIPSVSSETESQSHGNRPLYSDWQEGSLGGAPGLSLEDLLDEGAAQPESADFNVGSFSLHRPQSELFMKGLLGEAYDIAIGAAVENDELESYLQSRARARIMDTTVPDFQTWLTSRSEGISERIFLNSADYLTDYLTASVVDGAEGLNFVRTIEWDYQSTLGERRWQTGLSALGALRESDTDAIAWQLRGYAAEDSGTGANVGLIYRRVTDSAGSGLLGVNVFLDYEKHGDYDEDFLRWSVGGEYRNAYLDIYLNRYFPISDAVLQDGDYVYTQGGQEAYINLKAPDFGIGQVSGGLTYYQWEGEYGDADDKGFRYHIGFSPQRGNLNLEVELDSPDGGDVDWGGRVSYRHIIGSADRGNASASAADFDARSHFFDSVRREYAQRIRNSGEAERVMRATLLDAEDLTFTEEEAQLDIFDESSDDPVTEALAVGETITLSLSQTIAIVTEETSTVSLSAPSWTVSIYQESQVSLVDLGSTMVVNAGTVAFDRSGDGLNGFAVSSARGGAPTRIDLVGTQGVVGVPTVTAAAVYNTFVRLTEGTIELTVTSPTQVSVEVVGDEPMAQIVLQYDPATTPRVPGRTPDTDPDAEPTMVLEVGCATTAQRDAHRLWRADFTGCPNDVRVGGLGAGQQEVLQTQGETLTLVGVTGGSVSVFYDPNNLPENPLTAIWDAYPFHAGGSTLEVAGAPVALSYGQGAELVVALDSTVAFFFVDAAIAETATQAVSIYAAIEGGDNGAISGIAGTPNIVGCTSGQASRASEGLVSVVAVCGAPSFVDDDGQEISELPIIGVINTEQDIEVKVDNGGGEYRFELEFIGGGPNILQLEPPTTGAVAMLKLNSHAQTVSNIRYRLTAEPRQLPSNVNVDAANIDIIVEVVDEFTARERNKVVARIVTELDARVESTVIHTIAPVGALGAVSYAYITPSPDPTPNLRDNFQVNSSGEIILPAAIPAADIAAGGNAALTDGPVNFRLEVQLTDAGSTPPSVTIVAFTVEVRHPSGHVASDVVTVSDVKNGDYAVYRTDATGDVLTFSNTKNLPDSKDGILAVDDYTYTHTPNPLPSGFEFITSGTNKDAANLRIDSGSPLTAGQYDINISIDDDHSLTDPFVVNAKISIVAPLALDPATGEADVNLAAPNPTVVANVGAVTFNGGHGDKTYALGAVTPAGAATLFAVDDTGMVTFTSNPGRYNDDGPDINVPIVVSDAVESAATYALVVTAHAALNVPNRVVPRQVVDEDHTADFHTPADGFIEGGKKPYVYKLEAGAVSSDNVGFDNDDFVITPASGALRLVAGQTAPATATISVAVEGDAGGVTYYKLTVEITDDILLTPAGANPPRNPTALDIGYNDSGVIARVSAAWPGGANYGSFTYALDPDNSPNPAVTGLSVDSDDGEIRLANAVSRADSSEVKIVATPAATNFNFSGVASPTLVLNLNFHEPVSFTNPPDDDDIVESVSSADNPAPAEADRDDNALYTFMAEGGTGNYDYSIVSGDEGIVAFSDSTDGALVQVGAVNGLALVNAERVLNLVVRVTDETPALGGNADINVKATWRRVDQLTVDDDGNVVGKVITQVETNKVIHEIEVSGEKGVVVYALVDPADPANDDYAALRDHFTVDENGMVQLGDAIPVADIATGGNAAPTDAVDFRLTVEVSDGFTSEMPVFIVQVRHPSGHVDSDVATVGGVQNGDYRVYSQAEAGNILNFTNTRNLPDTNEGISAGGSYTYTPAALPDGFVLGVSDAPGTSASLQLDSTSPPAAGQHEIDITVDDNHDVTTPREVVEARIQIVEPLEINPASPAPTNVNLAAVGAELADFNTENGYGNKNYEIGTVVPETAEALFAVNNAGVVTFNGNLAVHGERDGDFNVEIIATDEVGGRAVAVLAVVTHPPLAVANGGVVPTQAVDKDFTDSFHSVGDIVSSGRPATPPAEPYTYALEVESDDGLDETDFDITGGELSLAEAQTTVPAMAEVTVTVADTAHGVTMYTVPVEIVDVVFIAPGFIGTPQVPVNPAARTIGSSDSGRIAVVRASLSGTATDYGAFTYALEGTYEPDGTTSATAVPGLTVDPNGDIELDDADAVSGLDSVIVRIEATPPTAPNLSGAIADTFNLNLNFGEAAADVTFTDPPERIVRGVTSGAAPSGEDATLATFAAAGGTGVYNYSIESGDTANVLGFPAITEGKLVQTGVVDLAAADVTLDLVIKATDASEDSDNSAMTNVRVIWRKVGATTNADKRFYLLGGLVGTSNSDDVWATNESSTQANGTSWTRVASSAEFPARENHAAAELGGTLFVSGGSDGSVGFADVWASGDNGFSWSAIVADIDVDIAFSDPINRRDGYAEGHAMVNYGGTLHIIGGNDPRPASGASSNARDNILYSSGDGKNWTHRTPFNGFSARTEMAVVEHKGELYVIGGATAGETGQKTPEVWKSTAGTFPVFAPVTQANPPPARDRAQAVSYGNRIYLIGGRLEGANADVWSSQDGGTWELETSTPAFGNLSGHVAYVKEGLMFVAAGDANGATAGGQVNAIWSSSNGVEWESVAANQVFPARHNAAAIVHQPAVRIMGPAAEDIAAAVSPSPAGGDLLVVTVARGFGAAGAAPVVAIKPANPYFTLTSDASSVVITVRQAIGVGVARTAETFNIEATQTDFGTDTFSGAVTWTEKPATEFDPVLPNAHLFVIGGIDDADNLLNDVWTSADDGKNWKVLTESLFPDGVRDGAAVAAISNTVYISGGVITDEDDGTTSTVNQVYSSDNGVDWNLVTPVDTQFPARRDHAMVSHIREVNGTDSLVLYVIGGINAAGDYLGDAYYSSNGGATWTDLAVSEDVGGANFGNRSEIVALSHDGSLFVIGGKFGETNGVGIYSREVYASEDGEAWTKAGELPFIPNSAGFNAVSFQERIYLTEGNNVWASVDGATWEEVTGAAAFAAVGGHGMVAQGDDNGSDANNENDNKMFVLGGVNSSDTLLDSVYSSSDGAAWAPAAAGDKFSARTNLAAAVFKPALGLPVPGAVVESKAPHTIGTPLLTLLANGGNLEGFSPAEAYRYDIVDDSGAITDIANIAIDRESGVLSIKQAATDTAIVVILTVQVDNRADQTADPSPGVITVNLNPPAAEALAQLVIIGGLNAGSADGTAAENNQVWTSADGSDWDLITPDDSATDVFAARKQLAAVEMGGTIYISGGRTGDTAGEGNFADVWASIDGGKNWVKRADGRFPARYNHQMLIHDGSLFIIGGVGDDDILSDAWHSADGAAWEALEVAAGGELGHNRNYFAAFSDNNFLIVAGGHADTRARFYNVVDPSDPTKSKWDFTINELNPVGLIAFNPSQDGPAAGVTLNEGLYLFFNNTVFQSSDGSTGGWEAVDPNVTGDANPFYYYAAAAHNGKIYVSGGADADNNLRNGVWSWTGVNGVAWQGGDAVDSGYYFRDHAMVSYPPGAAVTPIPPLVAFPVGANADIDVQLPAADDFALTTFTAENGSGNYSYKIVSGNDDNRVALAAGGELTQNGAAPDAGTQVVLVIKVTDTDTELSDTVTLTVRWLAAGTPVTPDPDDSVEDGILLVIAGNNGGATEQVWASNRNKDSWTRIDRSLVRNSLQRFSHAAATLGGTIFVSAGRRGEGQLTDVWASANKGVNWSNVGGVASRAGHAMVNYGGTLHVIGGHDGDIQDVILQSSGDGKNWTNRATTTPAFSGFSPRHEMAVVEHKDDLYVIGGVMGGATGGVRTFGIWKTTKDTFPVFTNVIEDTPADIDPNTDPDPLAKGDGTFEPTPRRRADAQAVSLGERMYLIGGRVYSDTAKAEIPADVWSSLDGVTWTRETAAPAFGNLHSHVAYVQGGFMFVTGGRDGGSFAEAPREPADTSAKKARLWKSNNGKDWTEVALATKTEEDEDGNETETIVGTIFTPRDNMAGVVLASLPSLQVSAPANVVVNIPAGAKDFLFRVDVANLFNSDSEFVSYEIVTDSSGEPSGITSDESGNIFYTPEVNVAQRVIVTVKVTDEVSGDSKTVETIVDWVAPADGDATERVLVIGGEVVGKGESNDIYASEDGINWAELTRPSGENENDIFPKRIGHAAAALGGTVYVSGGDSRVVGDLLNDVWASADGAHWTLRTQTDEQYEADVAAAVTRNAALPANTPEDQHEALPEDKRFPARRHHKMVAHNGTLFVIGGAANGTTGKDGEDPLNDVWVSTDGAAWTQSGAGDVLGHARDSFLVFSHNGALLAVAGNQVRDQVLAYNDRGTPELADDTWDDAGTITGKLVNPDGTEGDLIDLAPHGVGTRAFPRRDKAFYAGAAGAVFNGKMYILARNNVWRLDRPSSSSVSTERVVEDTYNCIADSELVGHKAVQLGDKMLVIGGIDSKLREFRGVVQSDVWASAANDVADVTENGWDNIQRHPGFRARHDHAVVVYRPIDSEEEPKAPLNPPATAPLTLGHPCGGENVKTNKTLAAGNVLFTVQASGGSSSGSYAFEIEKLSYSSYQDNLTVVAVPHDDYPNIAEVRLTGTLEPLTRNTQLLAKVKVTRDGDESALTVPVNLETQPQLVLEGPLLPIENQIADGDLRSVEIPINPNVAECRGNWEDEACPKKTVRINSAFLPGGVAPVDPNAANCQTNPTASGSDCELKFVYTETHSQIADRDLRIVEIPTDPNTASCRNDWANEDCPKEVVYIESNLRATSAPVNPNDAACRVDPNAAECPHKVVYIGDEQSNKISNLDRAARIEMQGRMAWIERLKNEGFREHLPDDEDAYIAEVGPTKVGTELFRVRTSGGSFDNEGSTANYVYSITGVISDNALDGNSENDNANTAYFSAESVGVGTFGLVKQALLVDTHFTVTVAVAVTDSGNDGTGTDTATLSVKVELFPMPDLALEGYHYPPGEELPRIAIIPRRPGELFPGKFIPDPEPPEIQPNRKLFVRAPELVGDLNAQYYGIFPLGNFEPSPRYPQRERKIYQGAARFDLPAPQANDEELLELLRVQATGKEKSAGGYDLNIVAAAFIRDGERPDDDPDIVVDYGDRIEAVVAEDAPNFIGEDNSNLFIIRLKDNTLPKLNDKNERLSIHLKVSNGGTEDEDTVTMKVEINLLPPAAESEQAAPLGVLVIGGRGNNNENDPRQVNNILFFDAVTTFKWKQLSPAADFSPRSGHAAAVLDGTVYISGGVSIRFVAQGEPLVTTSLDEVWYSDDFGVNWSLNTGTPFPARSSHKMIEHDGTLFVIGGVDGDGEILNDIWTSTDGANWTKSAATLDNDRESFMAFVYKGTLMVAGGRNVADTTAKEAVTEVNRAFRAYDTKGTKVVSDDIVLTLTATRAGDVVTTPAALPPLPNNLYITARANNPDSPQGAPLDPHNSDKSVGAAAAVFNDTIIIYARNHIWHTDGTTWTRSTTQAPYSYLYHDFGAVRPTRSADSVRRVGHLPVVRSDEEGDDTSLVLIGGTGHSSTGTLDEGSTIWPSGNGIAFADAPPENLPGSLILGGSQIKRYGHAVVALNPKVVKTEPEMPTEEPDTRPLFVIGGDNRNDVWVSEDNGAEWESLTEELFPGSVRSGIAVAVVDGITDDDTPASDNDRVYVSSADADGRLEEVRTSQTGVDWTVVELDNNDEFPSISGYAMLPFYNSEVQYNEGFVLIGGKDASDDYLNDVWKYEAHNGFFNKMDDAPFTGRSDFVALVHQEGGVDVFFVMGGVTDDDNDGTPEQSNEVWAGTYGATGLDRFDLEWETTKRADLPFTPNGDDFNAVSFGGEIYLFNDNDIWKSTDGRDWGSPMTDAAPFDDIDDYTVLARAGDKMYVLGGPSGAGEVWSSTDGTDWTEETENTAAANNFLAPRTNGVAAAFEPSFRLIGAPARVQVEVANQASEFFTLTAAWGDGNYQYAFGTITPNDFDNAHALIQLTDGAVSGAAGLFAAINEEASGEVTVQFYVTDGGGAGYIAPVVEVVFWVEKSSALFNVNPNTGTETVAADYASADNALTNPFHTPAAGLVSGGSGEYEYVVASVNDDDATYSSFFLSNDIRE